MNQFDRDGLLYQSPGGNPVTSLEFRGENLALYTEDNKVLNRFRHWNQLIYLIPYTQEQGLKHLTEVPVAYDLFFPKSARKQLLRVLTKKCPVGV